MELLLFFSLRVCLFLFFFFFSLSFFFLGAALEKVSGMAQYPHYTNGFAYGNFIMVIL
jgi:hypothetical protein